MPQTPNNPLANNPKMQQYFSSLPAYIQETIKQSGVQIQNEEELRQFVKNLNQNS